jgi:hypothetical protein
MCLEAAEAASPQLSGHLRPFFSCEDFAMARNHSSERSDFPGEAPRYPFLAAGRDPGGAAPMADLLARAQEAAALAKALMAMPRVDRLQAARQEARFHRRTLLTLFNLEAESALLQPRGRDVGEEEAEAATVLAARLPRDPRGRVGRAGALAHWLLGKARLHRGDLAGAVQSFVEIVAFLDDPEEPCEEKALAAAGWAQVDQQVGAWDEAVAHFQQAAFAFAHAGATLPTAACLAEIGFILLTTNDLLLARRNLERAWKLLDSALAPTVAARIALSCAEIEVRLAGDAESLWLQRAHSLYPLPAQPFEELARAWTEGRIATAAGRYGEAELLLQSVRPQLLAQGSLSEAVRISCDHLTLRLEAAQPLQVDALADALDKAFPHNDGAPWAGALLDLAKTAAARGRDAYYTAVQLLVERLSALAPVAGRPDLLPSLRVLTDRLLRHHGEFEDPIGAARA